MSSTWVQPAPSKKAIEEFFRLQAHVNSLAGAIRIWERYFTAAERMQLGNDFNRAYNENRTEGMWALVRGVTRQRAVIDAAHAIGMLRKEDQEWLLREIGETVNVAEAMERAIANGNLVLCETPRAAYWRTAEISIDWYNHDASWEFIWKLARCSKAGRALDTFEFGDGAHRNIVKDRKSRLLKLNFPIDLGDLMEPNGLGETRLILPAERIRIFQPNVHDELEEWLP